MKAGNSIVIRVGIDGIPIRYQQGAYVSMQMSGRFIRQYGWYRRSEAFVPI